MQALQALWALDMDRCILEVENDCFHNLKPARSMDPIEHGSPTHLVDWDLRSNLLMGALKNVVIYAAPKRTCRLNSAEILTKTCYTFTNMSKTCRRCLKKQKLVKN